MKALFVGLGSVGQRHLRNLTKINSNIDVLAVRSKRIAPVLSDNNKVIKNAIMNEHYGLQEFDSLDEALKESPEMVFVTNPSSMHLDVAKKALLSDAFVFIEKPLSHDWEGVENLLIQEKEYGQKKIAIGYQFRFHPMLKLLKKTLAEQIIGKIVSVRLVNGEYMPNWHPYEDYKTSYAGKKSLGGGALVTQIHDFDYVMWLFGKPTKVFAVGGKLSNLEIDVEDSVQTLMSFNYFGKNIPVSIHLDYLQWPPERSISIIGDLGTIYCNLSTSELIINQRSENKEDRHEFSSFDRNNLFKDEIANFLDFVSGKSDPVSDLQSGAASLKVALAAKKSMNMGNIQKLSWT